MSSLGRKWHQQAKNDVLSCRVCEKPFAYTKTGRGHICDVCARQRRNEWERKRNRTNRARPSCREGLIPTSDPKSIFTAKLYKERPLSKTATEPLSDIDLAWTAGFLEGDGSFLLNRSRAKIMVPQVNREPLEYLQSKFGGRISVTKINGGTSTINHWYIYGERALMSLIRSHLSSKRKRQIDLAFSKNSKKHLDFSLSQT